MQFIDNRKSVFLSLAIGQDRSVKGYGRMRKLSRFLPFFSKAVIHFGVKPRPAQVSPFGPDILGEPFLPLSGWTCRPGWMPWRLSLARLQMAMVESHVARPVGAAVVLGR
ncbi:MAG TPA: hypothetical protein VII91_03030 [Bauldia sp.]